MGRVEQLSQLFPESASIHQKQREFHNPIIRFVTTNLCTAKSNECGTFNTAMSANFLSFLF